MGSRRHCTRFYPIPTVTPSCSPASYRLGAIAASALCPFGYRATLPKPHVVNTQGCQGGPPARNKRAVSLWQGSRERHSPTGQELGRPDVRRSVSFWRLSLTRTPLSIADRGVYGASIPCYSLEVTGWQRRAARPTNGDAASRARNGGRESGSRAREVPGIRAWSSPFTCMAPWTRWTPRPPAGALVYGTRLDRREMAHSPLLKSPRVPAERRVGHDRLRRSLQPWTTAGSSIRRGSNQVLVGQARGLHLLPRRRMRPPSARRRMEPRSSRCSFPLLAWPGGISEGTAATDRPRIMARRRAKRSVPGGPPTPQPQSSIKGSLQSAGGVDESGGASRKCSAQRGGSGGYLASKGVLSVASMCGFLMGLLDGSLLDGPFVRDSGELWSSLHMGV